MIGGIGMLTRDMIARDVDYSSLGFLESHLMHEVKRLGERGFIEKYKDIIKKITSNDYEFNFALALLQYYNKWIIDSQIKEHLARIL